MLAIRKAGQSMISEEIVSEIIDTAEVDFRWCWSQLAAIKNGSIGENFGEVILSYQIRLYRGMHVLDKTYRSIIKFEKNLISRKKELEYEWFRKEMAGLKSYRVAIQEAFHVGRVLGDGFAWIFYRSQHDLVDEHLKLQPQNLLSPGLGGLGEKEVLIRLQGFEGNFVILHSLTSFLRLGDITLFNPSTRTISAIGEVKTQHEGPGRARITVSCITNIDKEPDVPHNFVFDQADIPGLPPDMKQRLKRQMNEIAAAFQFQIKNVENMRDIGRFHFSELGEVIDRSVKREFSHKIASKLVDRGLILCALSQQHPSNLSKNLLRKPVNLEDRIAGIQDIVNSIFDENLVDNSLFIGCIGPRDDGSPVVLQGTIPIAWWPVTANSLEAVIFGDVSVITLHNPAHFWNSLRQEGFEVEVSERGRLHRISRKHGNSTFELRNPDRFELLVRHFLMSEKTVIDYFLKLFEFSLERSDGRPIEINIDLRMTEQ